MAGPMTTMPKKTRPRPITAAPWARRFSFLGITVMAKPTATNTSAHRVTLKAMICAVIVVPMLAPRMTGID